MTNMNEIILALVGNKSDDWERTEVNKKEAEALADKLGATMFQMVSAKTGDNIEKFLNLLGEHLIRKDP